MLLENWLTGCTKRVVVNSSFSSWGPVASWISIERLFGVFMNDPDDGIKRTLMEFADESGRGHFGRERHPAG